MVAGLLFDAVAYKTYPLAELYPAAFAILHAARAGLAGIADRLERKGRWPRLNLASSLGDSLWRFRFGRVLRYRSSVNSFIGLISSRHFRLHSGTTKKRGHS